MSLNVKLQKIQKTNKYSIIVQTYNNRKKKNFENKIGLYDLKNNIVMLNITLYKTYIHKGLIIQNKLKNIINSIKIV